MTRLHFANGTIGLQPGPIARLWLCRPEKANAINSQMWEGLVEAWQALSKRDDTRVLILRGDGKHFSSGADTTEFESAYASTASTDRYNRAYRRAIDDMAALPFPVLAVLHGAVIGSAVALATAADLRLAARDAQLTVSAAKLGFAYSLEDSARLLQLIGLARTKEMLFSARAIPADEARGWGLVNCVVAPEGLEATVTACAETIATQSRTALAGIKTILDSLSTTPEVAVAPLRRLYSESFQSADAAAARAKKG
jgi:enoyl-CoA hydratase/carnithine racemase